MHEMSIAEGILDIALEAMKANDASVIQSIQLDLGRMSGVEADALLFCFDSITKGTPAEGATLEITFKDIEGRCFDCGTVFKVENYKFLCPKCGSRIVQTVSGKQLQVTSVDIE